MSHDPQYGETPATPGYGQPGYGQPGYPPPGHFQQGYPQGYPAPPTNTMAILALIFAFVFWPLAIVFGHIAHRQIGRTGEGGRGLATAGLVLGYLFLALTVLGIIAIVALAGAAVSNDPYAMGLVLTRVLTCG